ncbi:MAG TPA: hydroxymethylbilane synthase [Kofleriaceae bacterium]|jgi:hydroxymethylbilane synthase|nr:hydroxymethylbilane synthase [Kofleriaceae bacterium]
MKTRIATRGSALALWQANHVRDALRAREPGLEVDLVVIKTQGDKILDVPLAAVGGKGLFVKEIEQALVDGAADIAVHSMKDVPADLAPGLTMAAMSAREDPRDALVSAGGRRFAELPVGARVGTSSLRRQCQLLAARSDLRILTLRGNVPTRLRKLDDGDYDAVVLAAAGLVRLGHADRITEHLDPALSLPAVGQGVLGLETRADDAASIARVRAALHDADGADQVIAERAFLARLGGGCQTPLAAHATLAGPDLWIQGLVGTPDGTRILRAQRSGPRAQAADLGRQVADELLAQGAAAILAG